jgi:hypothetical protein
MDPGFDLFREQVAGEDNQLSCRPGRNRAYVIARTRQIVRQVDQYLATPDLTEAEHSRREVIDESFVQLAQKAGGTP